MPDVLLVDLEHLEARVFEGADPGRIRPLVREASVVQLALDLEYEGVKAVAEVDAADPSFVAAGVDLAIEAVHAGLFQQSVDPPFEARFGWAVVGSAFVEEVTREDQTGASWSGQVAHDSIY